MEIFYDKLHTFSIFFLDALTYFIIAMIGALVKDVYDVTVGSRIRFEIKKIFVGTMLSTFIIFAARGYMNDDWIIAVTFILGVIGWELFSRVSTIDGMKNTIIGFKKMMHYILHGGDPPDDERENHNHNHNENP